MKLVVLVTSGLLAAAVAVAAAKAEGKLGDYGREEGGADDRLQSARREEKVFAFFTTTSVKRLSTTTITALSTCLSITMNPPACTGRRRRSVFNSFSGPTFPEVIPEELVGSQVGSEELPAEQGPRVSREVVNGREGKRLTIWSTFSSTLTLTSTSYVTGTTVTATALCIAPGLTAGCFGR